VRNVDARLRAGLEVHGGGEHLRLVRTFDVHEVGLGRVVTVSLESPLELGVEVIRHSLPLLVLAFGVPTVRLRLGRVAERQNIDATIRGHLGEYVVLNTEVVLGVEEHDTGVVLAVGLGVDEHGIDGDQFWPVFQSLAENGLGDFRRHGKFLYGVLDRVCRHLLLPVPYEK